MKSKELLKGASVVLIGLSLMSNTVFAQGAAGGQQAEASAGQPVTTATDAATGRAYFEGSKRFANGGASCISCHNVTNDAVMPGGLLAKDLTDVYERLGEGLTAWLGAPPFPAMVSTYQNHPLTEQERMSLTAFLKDAYETRASQKAKTGYDLFLLGGGAGLLGILILISLLWMKRKRQMVKKDIFARQSKAWDAKH